MNIQHYGWVPDLPDQRDHTYAAPAQFLLALPNQEDLRPGCPPVYDQGQLGSCTGNAIAGAIEFEQMKQKAESFAPSRLFIYYNERVLEHTVDSDSGAQIRDGMKVVAKQGAPPETDWPYDISKFADKPPAIAFTDAAKNRVLSYQRVSRALSQFKGCLASGIPLFSASPCMTASRARKWPARAMSPCPSRRKKSPATMPFWPWATTIKGSGSSSATPGDHTGEFRAISPCPINISWTRIYRTISGPSG